LLFLTHLAKRIFSRSDQFQNPAGRNQLSANPARKVENKNPQFKRRGYDENKTRRAVTILTGLDMRTRQVGGRNFPLAAGNTPISCSRGLN